MAEAIKCDKCGQFQEGAPSGEVIWHDGGIGFKLCKACVSEVMHSAFPQFMAERQAKIEAQKQVEAQEAQVQVTEGGEASV